MISHVKTSPKQKTDLNTNPTTPKKSHPKVGFKNNRVESVRQRHIQRMAFKHVSKTTQGQNSINPSSIQMKNNTGLPNQLKSGIENLSGFSMNDVKVHYNSPKPAQLQAHAYAQGTNIHLGPGQEKHLPHEAWHVVQQKQGRVKPTMQMKGQFNINDDPGLEKEADIMGTKSNQFARTDSKTSTLQRMQIPSFNDSPIQMMTRIKMETQNIGWPVFPIGPNYSWKVGHKTEAKLDWNDTRKGTAPEDPVNDPVHKLNGQYGERNFVRGHLLNARLGGLGIWDNMFPITGEANKKHASGIEATAKEYLIAAKGLDDALGHKLFTHTVQYNVQAIADSPNNFLTNPNGRFVCTVALRDFWGNRVPDYPDQSDVVLSKHQHLDRGQETALDKMGWGYNKTDGGHNRSGLSGPTGYVREMFWGQERIKDNSKAIFKTHSDIGQVNGNLQTPQITANSAMSHIKDLLGTLRGEQRVDFLHNLEDQIGDLLLEEEMD